MSSPLNVFKDNRLIGTLREDAGKLVFAYEESWLESSDAQPVTGYLPLKAGSHSGEEVDSFFGNLLPEGEVLQKISKWTHISPENVFGLLERFGGDTLGAYFVLPAGVDPGESRYFDISREQLREWIENMKSKPLVLNAKGARISLSGAQDKMSLYIRGEELLIPIGAAPSTHIIKPRIAGRHGVEHSSVNEAFAMMLGKAVGLDVANAEYQKDILSVVVERYDREVTAHGIERLHQLDFCQMLNIPSAKKYEAEGGPSLKDCFDVVRTHTSQPALHVKRLMGWLAFNAIIGNMDGHAKNLSIITRGRHKDLAPFYDLLCTGIYRQLSQKLAFKIGGENRPRLLMKRHWERLAGELSMKAGFVLKIVSDTTMRVESGIADAAEKIRPLLDAREKMFIEEVSRMILSNAKEVRKNTSRDIPSALKKEAEPEGLEDFVQKYPGS